LKQHSSLGNDGETDNGTKSVARQQIFNEEKQTAAAIKRLGKHVPSAMDKHATIEVLMETGFSLRSALRSYKEDKWATKSVLYGV
jgi:hypothetical protein